MWHTFMMEYYSAIKNWVICRDVDGPRVCHSEWSQSEREKQILYINLYMWNLKKWYWWTCLQGRNRCGCREWTHGHRGEGERGMNWETRVEYIHYYVKNRQLVANSPSLFKTHLRCHLNNLTNIEHWLSWHILGMKSLDDVQEELEWFPYRANGHGSPPLLLPLTSSIAYPFSTSASQTLACVQITWESY